MEDQPSRTDTLVRMATHALVAGATLPLGPAGAAVGAAGAVLFDAAAEADRRVWRRFDRLVEEATADAGISTAELKAWASANDERLAFVRDLVSAALTTLDEQKARALGRVLADALQDEALLHERPLILRTLRDLDPVHVVLLRSMVFDDNPLDPTVRGAREGETSILSGHRWTYFALCEHHPRIGGMLMANVLAALERHGLVTRRELHGDTYNPTGYVIPVLGYLADQDGPDQPINAVP